MKLAISTCLLGEPVRYDGGHKLDTYLRDTLGQFVKWVPVCPEVECGMPIPRKAMHLKKIGQSIRLVTTAGNKDLTEMLTSWTHTRIAELIHLDLRGFVFKSKSPSCGTEKVSLYTQDSIHPQKTGTGLFFSAFVHKLPLIPCIDEGKLHDPRLRSSFLDQIFTYDRWRDYMITDGTLAGLIAFHQQHKYLIMAHSPQLLKKLGHLVATPSASPELHTTYLSVLMEALRSIPSKAKQINVLQHCIGYFKHQLTPEDKMEFLEALDHYSKGVLPHSVPLSLLNHYVRIYNQAYLKGQLYLNPYPVELQVEHP